MGKVGNPYKFKDAETLKAKVDAYFEYCKTNPIRGQRTIRKEDGETVMRDEQYPRPLTFEGLCNYVHIGNWTDFVKDNKERPGFAELFDYIRNTIRQNQIEGGLVGIYNPNLTARLNGIAENIQTNELPAPQILADEDE